MANEINGFRPRTLDTSDSKSTGRTPAPASGRAGGTAAPATAPATTDSVRLTDTAARLQRLDELMANTSEVDTARVEELRKQIAEGRYQPDSVHVTDKLIALERSLFDTPKR